MKMKTTATASFLPKASPRSLQNSSRPRHRFHQKDLSQPPSPPLPANSRPRASASFPQSPPQAPAPQPHQSKPSSNSQFPRVGRRYRQRYGPPPREQHQPSAQS